MPKKPIAYRGSEPFVFVSYAHADTELAYPIISGLQERGLRVWFDDGLDVGDIWEEVLADHVEQCAAMLCLVSTRFTDSNNCLDEIFYAREQKKELLILHLEDQVLPRNFRFRYGRYHAERLSAYSDRSVLLERLTATEKLRCCLGQAQGGAQETEESPEDIYQKGEACAEVESYEEAVNWYRKAAEQGHAEAIRSLGVCYQNGYGVPQSWEDAARYYRQAADKGDAEAMGSLGYCYERGYGVSKSLKEAIMWYRRGADKGDSTAMNNIGVCYDVGCGVRKSHEEAVAWYRRAIEKGNATAMRNLANCYTYGWGVTKDKKQAEYWENKAKQTEAAAANP